MSSLDKYKMKKLHALDDILDALAGMDITEEVINTIQQIQFYIDVIENTVWRLKAMYAYMTAMRIYNKVVRAKYHTPKCNFCGETVKDPCAGIRQSWGCDNNPDGILN